MNGSSRLDNSGSNCISIFKLEMFEGLNERKVLQQITLTRKLIVSAIVPSSSYHQGHVNTRFISARIETFIHVCRFNNIHSQT